MSFTLRASLSPSIPRDGLNFWFDAQNHPNLGNSDIATDRTANYSNFSINNSGSKVNYNTDGGGSFDFSGSTNVYVKTPINIITPTNSLTLALWFRRTTTPVAYAGLFYNRTTGGIAGIHFGNTPGNSVKLRYTWNNANFDVETGLTTSLNIWTFCSLSIRSNGATFTMISGTGSKSTFSHTGVTNTALSFTSSFLGWDGFGSRYFIGGISQAFFYTRDLSDSEVQRIYDTTISRHYPLGFQTPITTTTTTPPTTTTTTSTTTEAPVVNDFEGRQGADLNELCQGGGEVLTLYSSKVWSSLKGGDILYLDNGLNEIWKDNPYFYNISEHQYIEINQGDGKMMIKPTAC